MLNGNSVKTTLGASKIDSLIREVDTNGDGAIDFQDATPSRKASTRYSGELTQASLADLHAKVNSRVTCSLPRPLPARPAYRPANPFITANLSRVPQTSVDLCGVNVISMAGDQAEWYRQALQHSTPAPNRARM